MFSKKDFFSLVFALCVTVINAQNNENYIDYGESGKELVITASRTPEAAKDVPAQITVITAGDIAQSGAVSAVDVLGTVPGVRFSGAQMGAGSEAISMRGFGENSYGRVLILVDGNKINDPDMSAVNWNTIPLANIERIEVLDGSASVLYGNYAVGGVINIITKKGGKSQTAINAAAGSFFTDRESLFHFKALDWGNYSLSIEHSGSKGYRDRQSSQSANLAVSSSVFIGDTIQFSFNGFFASLYCQLPGALYTKDYKNNPTLALNPNDENTEYHYGGGFSFRWFPTETIEFILPLSYRGKSIYSDMASYSSYTGKTIHSAEARPQGSAVFDIAGMPLKIRGGIDLYYSRLEGDVDSLFSPAAYTISQWVIGPYVTARFSPLPNLSFSAGSRFDTATLKAETLSGNADGNKTYHAFVYDAGIAYNPLDMLKLYARYAALFRYPFTDEIVGVYGTGFNTGLKPEKGFNAEAGVVWQLKDILNFTANFFYMQLEDEINVDPVTWINANLDKTRRLGTNVGLRFTPADFISFDGSYSWVHAVFTGGQFKDKRVPLVPMHTIYGSLMVHLPFGLSFGPNIEYASNRYYSGDFDNAADAMDGYFLWGARVRFVLDKNNQQLALEITAKNLLDTTYATFGTYAYWLPDYSYYPADGRSINVSVNYRF